MMKSYAITKTTNIQPFPQPTELVAKLAAPSRKPNTLMPSRSVSSFNPNINIPSSTKGPPNLKHAVNLAQLIPESEADDDDDDADLLKILEKLKDAKKTLDTTKQRKREREELESKYNFFVKETRSAINKHNRKWGDKINTALDNAKEVKLEYDQVHKRMEDEIQQFEYNLHELERSIDSALDFVEDFEQVVTKDDETFQEDTKSNFEQIQKETKIFMEDVKKRLIDLYNQSNKDDKLTRLIKTFLANI